MVAESVKWLWTFFVQETSAYSFEERTGKAATCENAWGYVCLARSALEHVVKEILATLDAHLPGVVAVDKDGSLPSILEALLPWIPTLRWCMNLDCGRCDSGDVFKLHVWQYRRATVLLDAAEACDVGGDPGCGACSGGATDGGTDAVCCSPERQRQVATRMLDASDYAVTVADMLGEFFPPRRSSE